jgi:glycerol-3-phosphate dehydrogenase
LPGGDFSPVIGKLTRPDHDFVALRKKFAQRYAWIDSSVLDRLSHQYGARLELLIGAAKNVRDLGSEVAPGLYEAELNYLIEHEWARTAEDVLWRRTKLGLHMGAPQREQVANWFEHRTTKAVVQVA